MFALISYVMKGPTFVKRGKEIGDFVYLRLFSMINANITPSPPHLQSLYEKIRTWEEEGPGVEERAEWVRSCDRREKLKGDGAKPGSIYILIQWSEADEEDHCRSRLPPSLNLSSAATCHRRRRGDPSWFSILQVRQPNFQRFFLATSDPAKTTNVKSTPSSLSPSLAPTPS